MSGYCAFAPTSAIHQPYHDYEYGFPNRDDYQLFERLILEINQAGLSWELMLKKRETFRAAYSGFDIASVASYGEADISRLLLDPGVIRNKLKVNAAITNARKILELQAEYGSFAEWLDAYHPLTLIEWRKLFKKTFVFTGGEIVNEFLMSLGYLPGAHSEDCPIYAQIARLSPPFLAHSDAKTAL